MSQVFVLSEGKKASFLCVYVYISQKNFSTISYSNLHSTVPAIFLLALITVSRQITSGNTRSPARPRSVLFVAVLFPVPRKMLLKAGDFQQRNDAPRPFPFPDDDYAVWGREGRRFRGLAHSEGLFSFLRAASLESRINHARSPGAFEPLSFIVSTTSPSHDSNPRTPSNPLPPTSSLPQPSLFRSPPFTSFPLLSMALRLTTNFSSRPTFLHPRARPWRETSSSRYSLLGGSIFSSHAVDATWPIAMARVAIAISGEKLKGYDS